MVGIGGIGVAVGGKGVAVGGTGVEVTTIISGGTPLVQEPERVSGFFLFSYHLRFYMPRIGASDYKSGLLVPPNCASPRYSSQ